jgi:hypothetical protein
MKIDWRWKTIKKGDYLYGKCPEHPYADKNGYVLEHRLVAEKKIGRLLTADEHVHHINRNKHDNRPENLEVLMKEIHHKHHGEEKIVRVVVKCAYCKEKFLLHGNKYNEKIKIRRNIFCSRSCNAKYYGLGITIKPPVSALRSKQ